MNIEERIKKAQEEARKSAKEIFKDKPKEIKDELEKESAMGNPENLVRPDSKDE